jgi:hypothetical protein
VTTLGEAYIAVKADMRPFTRDLKKEVEKVVEDVEKNIHRGLGESLTKGSKGVGAKVGEEFADEFEETTKRRFGNKNQRKPWMVRIAAALAGALDDGISALPMQAKAAIVFGIILALPIISGALATAVAAGVAAGLAGIGVALAFQYDIVRKHAGEVFNDLRVSLSTLAEPFIAETLKGLDLITLSFAGWEPKLRKIFANASGFVEPLTRGLLGGLDKIIDSFANISDDLDPFVHEFSAGFEILSDAVGDFIEILVSTGEDGQVAFRDLVQITAGLIINLAYLIKIMAEVYGFMRKISQEIPFITGGLSIWFTANDQAAASAGNFGEQLNDLNYYQDANIVATQRQEQAIKELVTAMNDAYNAAFNLIDAEIAYEEAVDRLSESLERNGNTFNVKTKEGRENLRAFEAALKAIHEEVMGLLAEGKITAEQGKAMQDQLTEALYKQAAAAGANTDALHAMFDQATAFADIPVGNTGWLDQIQAKAKAAAEAIAKANAEAARLRGGIPGGGAIFSQMAEGGVVNGPTPAIVGEAGPEVIIPLTKPGRAAQLAQESGLASMLGMGSSQPTVYVFIGNDQLDSYMVRVVDKNNKALSTGMTYGARGL